MLPQGVYILHVLGTYIGNGYIEYIYFMLLYKREQQVERTLVLLYADYFFLHNQNRPKINENRE